jgi:Pyridoxamine 5'-phosphate oxidase
MTRAMTEDLRHFLDANTVGVLATPASDGRPRQSLVYCVRDDDRLLISTLTDGLKARDQTQRVGIYVRHGPRAAVPVRDAFGPGRNPHRAHRHGNRGDHAAHHPRGRASGPMSDEALAALGRMILAITVERVTAQNYIPTTPPPGDPGGEHT